jgi:hypothetical protein
MLFNSVGNKVYKLHYQWYSFFLKKLAKTTTAAAAAMGWKWKYRTAQGPQITKIKNYGLS